MNLDCFVKKLVDAGVGTAGQAVGSSAVPIFKNRMPPTATKGIMLRPPIEGVKVDNYLPGFFKSRMQVIVRAGLQADGDAIAYQVMSTLKSEQRETFTDANNNFLMMVNYIVLDSLPAIYTRDDSGQMEWSINFHLCYCMTPI